jgi:hypothetical protein
MTHQAFYYCLLRRFVLPGIALNKSSREAKKADDQKYVKENWDCEANFIAKF